MKKQFHIGEISQFFDLPPSTLRYWEEAGVLSPEKNAGNNYREYSIDDLMALSDIIFYKSLGIPLKQISQMEHSTPEEHAQLFSEKIETLTTQERQIRQRIKKLHYRLSAVRTLQELKAHPFSRTDIDTDCIVSFDLMEIEKLRQYIENPYLYSRVQDSSDISRETRGLTVPFEQAGAFPPSQILWQKTSSSYISCLMKEEVTEGFPNTLPELLSQIQKSYRTGTIISRFLLRAKEGEKLYDFYKTFVEVLP